MKHVQAIADHLKCDNPNCGYEQPIKMEHMGSWVNALCPHCDSVLLTQEDYDQFKMILEFVASIDEMADELYQAGDPEMIEAVELGRKASLKFRCKDGELEMGDVEWLDN